MGRDSGTVDSYLRYRGRGYSPVQSPTARSDTGVKREPITRPLSSYFNPHEINEYKA